MILSAADDPTGVAAGTEVLEALRVAVERNRMMGVSDGTATAYGVREALAERGVDCFPPTVGAKLCALDERGYVECIRAPGRARKWRTAWTGS